MGRSLRSGHGHVPAAVPDSAKLMIKCEGSWKESSVRGKTFVRMCVAAGGGGAILSANG